MTINNAMNHTELHYGSAYRVITLPITIGLSTLGPGTPCVGDIVRLATMDRGRVWGYCTKEQEPTYSAWFRAENLEEVKWIARRPSTLA